MTAIEMNVRDVGRDEERDEERWGAMDEGRGRNGEEGRRSRPRMIRDWGRLWWAV